ALVGVPRSVPNQAVTSSRRVGRKESGRRARCVSWTNRFSAARALASPTTATRTITRLLHIGLRLPLHERRIDLLEDLRVEDLLGRELLLVLIEGVVALVEVVLNFDDVGFIYY